MPPKRANRGRTRVDRNDYIARTAPISELHVEFDPCRTCGRTAVWWPRIDQFECRGCGAAGVLPGAQRRA